MTGSMFVQLLIRIFEVLKHHISDVQILNDQINTSAGL